MKAGYYPLLLGANVQSGGSAGFADADVPAIWVDEAGRGTFVGTLAATATIASGAVLATLPPGIRAIGTHNHFVNGSAVFLNPSGQLISNGGMASGGSQVLSGWSVPLAKMLIVALGASVIAGTGATALGGTCWALNRFLLQRQQAVSVINKGVGGNGLTEMAARWNTDVLPHQPQIVLLADGVYNDIANNGRSAATIQKTVDDLTFRTQAMGAVPVWVTPPPVGTSAGWTTAFENIKQTLKAYVRSVDSNAVDADAAYGTNAVPSVIRAGMDSGDHLHPLDPGHTALAGAIAQHPVML